MKLIERGSGGVHWNRREPFEAFWMTRNQIRVRVVDHLRDGELVLRVSEKDVWSRERNYLHVDPDAVHVFESLVDVGHCRRDAEKTCPAVSDDRLARRTGVEGKLRREIADRLKELLGVEVCV